MYDMGDMGDRIGVGVNYNVTPAFSIGIRVEEKFYNNESRKIGVPNGSPCHPLNSHDNEIPRNLDNSKGNF